MAPVCTVPRTPTEAMPVVRARLTASSAAALSATGPGARSASRTAAAGVVDSTLISACALATPLASSSR